MSAIAEKSPFRISDEILEKYEMEPHLVCPNIRGFYLAAAKRAEQNLTPVHLLTKNERMGLAIAAGVPVDFVDGKVRTSQPVGISRIAGHYHVYTRAA